MSDMGGFFDLSKVEAAELEIELRNEDKVCRVLSRAGDLFEIVNCIDADNRRDRSFYRTFVCQSNYVAERDIRKIIKRIDGGTLGYLIPISSFRDGENFEGKWLKRFADVAFRFATSAETLSAFSSAVPISSLRGRKVFLDEVFNDSLSIVVIGDEAFSPLSIDDPNLELNLLRSGVLVTRSKTDLLPTPPSASRSAISIEKPGLLVEQEAAVFLSLIKNADRDQMGVGAFMHLYQALEFCIDHIFSWRVEEIALERPSTWQMKEQLSKVTGESYRLGLLDANCLRNLHDRSSLNELADRCREFLTALDVKFKSESAWFQLLYNCRNIIVHNQIMMMRVPNIPLMSLVEALRFASLEILFNFCLPERVDAA